MRIDSVTLRRLSAISVVAWFVVGASHAHAGDEKATCIEAYEQAQKLRQEGHMSDAKKKLMVCVREVCPPVLRRDCDQWLTDLNQVMPSIVIAAKGPQGSDVAEVKVMMDGHVLTEHLDGKAISLDPGMHSFRFVYGQLPPIEQQLLLREGEKNRAVAISFSSAGPEAAAQQPTAPAASTEKHRPVPASVYVLGGVGMLALGSFAYFGLQGRSAASDLDACKPNCLEADVDRARTKLIIADVSLGVSVISLGTAVYLLLTRPEVDAAEKPATTTRWNVHPVAGGAVAGFSGAF
jgi:hypothetical protein